MHIFKCGPSLITSSELSKDIYVYGQNTYRYIYFTTATVAHGSSEYLSYSATHTLSPPHPSVLKDYLFYLQHQELQYMRNISQ